MRFGDNAGQRVTTGLDIQSVAASARQYYRPGQATPPGAACLNKNIVQAARRVRQNPSYQATLFSAIVPGTTLLTEITVTPRSACLTQLLALNLLIRTNGVFR
ncbi:hypothetical protein EHS86_12965 [Erwinia amylovora]|nr:hypothetical protein AD997_11855 [Erwinia amylovora]RWS37648.1 hypothetical protein EHS86_12965 [Erwinia amylovora]